MDTGCGCGMVLPTSLLDEFVAFKLIDREDLRQADYHGVGGNPVTAQAGTIALVIDGKSFNMVVSFIASSNPLVGRPLFRDYGFSLLIIDIAGHATVFAVSSRWRLVFQLTWAYWRVVIEAIGHMVKF